MILGLIIICLILCSILGFVGLLNESDVCLAGALATGITAFIIFIVGCFTGFIYHPPTEGTHQGVITAVDLEGTYFRRYEVYLKSSGYTNQSDETIYLLYDYEKELAEQIKEAIGKEVKLNYGHDGGYIHWKSCGTYHIRSFEIVQN